MYFESHAHYDDERFDEDRDELLKRIKEKGVEFVINAASDVNSSKKGIELSEKFDFIYAAVGVHPHETEHMQENDIDVLKELSKNEKVVAVGEIGLDFYYDSSFRDIQKYWFKKQLLMAEELNLPVIIHSRDAALECFEIIKESGVRKGVIHCYSGSSEMAFEYIKLGFLIGVGGVVTFNNAKKLVQVVEKIPIEKILIETDSPYLAPVPNRGKRNDSSNLFFIAEKIANIKKMQHFDVVNITKENAFKLFFK